MKNSPSKKNCKKKRNSLAQLKYIVGRALTDYQQLGIKNVSPRVRSLRPRNTSSFKHGLEHSNYKFKITRAIRKNSRAIKRTFINVGTAQVQNISQIPINDRIQKRGVLAVCENFDLRCSSKFLEDRYFNMAHTLENPVNSNGLCPKISITFEQMLSIRKKRLQRKRGKSDTVVGKKEQSDCVEVIDLDTMYQEIIEIKDDSQVADHENNNTENSCEIKLTEPTEQIDDVILLQLNEANSLPTISNEVGKIDQDIPPEPVKSVKQSEDSIGLNSFTIIDSVMEASVTENPLETAVDKMSVDHLSQSVIVIPSSRNEQFDIEPPPAPHWPSANSIIAISDTSTLCHDTSDDIIFVSEESHAPSTPLTTQRRSDRKPSVVIIEDDNTRQTHRTLNPLKKRKYKKTKRKETKTRKTKRKKHPGANQTPSHNAVRSELASCAEASCVNTQNRSHTTTITAYSTSCACKPCLHKSPEKSATVTQTQHDNKEQGSRLSNKFGSNIYNTGCLIRDGLRQIIIDGSNVALGHSNGTAFSVKGLQIAIDYFIRKGHKVKAFVPQFRLKFGQSTNPHLLRQLIDKRLVVLTPSREVNGRRITPYDDRYIIQYATTCEGIVVSNDNFRDLLAEKPEWRNTIEKRLLMYTWIDDILIFPEDPLGRRGPHLSQFLKFP